MDFKRGGGDGNKSHNGGRSTGGFGKRESGYYQPPARSSEGTRDIEGAILKHQSFFTNNSMVEPPSELILFSDQNSAPANYDAYKDVEVKTQNGEEKVFQDFSELKVAPALKQNIERCNYSHPTPVQRYTILHAQEGRDMQV